LISLIAFYPTIRPQRRRSCLTARYVVALLRLNFPALCSQVPNARAKPQADAIVDAVKVVDLPVALQDFDDAVTRPF
jgi:hypothetical protein